MKKLNYKEQKDLLRAINNGDRELSEHCSRCCIETDINHLNLSTGICFECAPSSMKLTKEQIKKLLDLYND